MRSLLAILIIGLTGTLASCEPEDTAGGKLTGIQLELVGKNPGLEGRYILLVGERSPLKGTGQYDNDREENITLSLFWTMQPTGNVVIECQQDDLGGNRVILEGASPGTVDITAFTREVDDSHIPCSPTPDGGWSFPDAGSEWPMQSEPLVVEVR
ncbi:hypothetical protein ACFL2F_00435 [Myxococcota bacterium]